MNTVSKFDPSTQLRQDEDADNAETRVEQAPSKVRKNHVVTAVIGARLGLGLLLLGATIAPETAFAQAGDGSEFDELVEILLAWIQGSLGKTIALAAFLVGMAIGVVKQSAMAAVTGIGIAAALVYVPNVIDSVFG